MRDDREKEKEKARAKMNTTRTVYDRGAMYTAHGITADEANISTGVHRVAGFIVVMELRHGDLNLRFMYPASEFFDLADRMRAELTKHGWKP